VRGGPADDRFLFLSDVLPTAWQAVQYAQIPERGSVAVLGLGPIGEMSTRIGQHLGAETVIGIDLVRTPRARRRARRPYDRPDDDRRSRRTVRAPTGGRGPDSVIDAVGMEAHGSPAGKIAHTLAGATPDEIAAKVMQSAGVDRLAALTSVVEIVRRGGTISLSGGLRRDR
jgi:threonine dehydrogenase-like Zn-dependent dehydrogenase